MVIEKDRKSRLEKLIEQAKGKLKSNKILDKEAAIIRRLITLGEGALKQLRKEVEKEIILEDFILDKAPEGTPDEIIKRVARVIRARRRRKRK